MYTSFLLKQPKKTGSPRQNGLVLGNRSAVGSARPQDPAATHPENYALPISCLYTEYLSGKEQSNISGLIAMEKYRQKYQEAQRKIAQANEEKRVLLEANEQLAREVQTLRFALKTVQCEAAGLKAELGAAQRQLLEQKARKKSKPYHRESTVVPGKVCTAGSQPGETPSLDLESGSVPEEKQAEEVARGGGESAELMAERELMAEAAMVQELRRDQARLLEEMEDLREENGDLAEEVKEAQQELEGVRADWRRESHGLRAELQQCSERAEQLAVKVRRLMEEAEKAKLRVEDLEETARFREDEIFSLKDCLQRVTTQNEALLRREQERKERAELLQQFWAGLKISEEKINVFLQETFGQGECNDLPTSQERLSYLAHLYRKKEAVYDGYLEQANQKISHQEYLIGSLQHRNLMLEQKFVEVAELAEKKHLHWAKDILALGEIAPGKGLPSTHSIGASRPSVKAVE